MAKETLEELRERLLRQHNVQKMIRVRAYEIYQMRGGQPGREAQDWFHAESEVLAFLLADETARGDDHTKTEPTGPASAANAPAAAPAAEKPKSGARRKSSEAKATAPKKPAAKSATPRRSAPAKSKTTRTSSKSKTEEGNK